MKKILIILCLFILFHSNWIIHASVQYSSEEICTLANKLEWKYEMINGHLYKRLYNATLQKWETDWILVK